MTATMTTQWATLLYDPTEPKPSQINPEYPAQHMATVQMDDGTQKRIYFNVGTYSALRKGDTVMLEYSKGKWRMSKTQPPELHQKLSQRGPATPAPVQPTTQGNAATFTPLDGDQKKAIAGYVDQMADVLAFCRKTAIAKLGDVDESAIQAATATLFIATQRKFGI